MTRHEMKQRIRELEALLLGLEARLIRLEQRDSMLSAKPRRWTWEHVVLDDTAPPRPKLGENGNKIRRLI